MDVLYFIKEEYASVREDMDLLVGASAPVDETRIRSLLARVALLVRVSDELILPEISESARKGLDLLAEAGEQTAEISKTVGIATRLGRLAEGRRRDFGALLTKHLDFMEKAILPMFREQIATQTREDLGIVALDFKSDLGVMGLNRADTPAKSIRA